MPSQVIGLDSITRIQKRLARYSAADYQPLMVTWEKRLKEGNRIGVLAGLDAYGNPMPATVRERTASLSQKHGSGKPLNPRDSRSRVIKDAVTAHGRTGSQWFATLAWENFLTKDGQHILSLHANPSGKARYPKRDLIGIRPKDFALAQKDLGSFIKGL
jgi:hypothetical protein